MSLTNAEKQAAHRARQVKTLEELSSANVQLLSQLAQANAESAALRAENQSLKERLRDIEISSLKAQLRASKRTKKS